MAGITETRWLVLATDGQHVTLSRHRDPELEEIERVETALRAQDLAGWLVVMKGGYYTQTKPQLMMVRPLGEPGNRWDDAVAGFETRWREAVRPTGRPPKSDKRPL